jgi:catalase
MSDESNAKGETGEKPILTNRQGHPIYDNTNNRTVGERYRSFEQWERDELINNLVGAVDQCNQGIQKRMIGHLAQCDEEYGWRVAEGLGLSVNELKSDSAGAR